MCAQQTENQIEHSLHITLRFVGKAVADACQIGTHTLKSRIHIVVAQAVEEVAEERTIVNHNGRKVVGGKAAQHTYAHFTVGIVENVTPRNGVVVLNREIAALVKQWQSIGHLFGRHIKIVDGSALALDVANANTEFLHHVDYI